MQVRVIFQIFFIISIYYIKKINGIQCYECTSGKYDQTCSQYVTTSCDYGFFGCVKIATFSGGVDKSLMFFFLILF